MKRSGRDDIMRYEAMARLCDYVNPSRPDEAEQDRAAYGAKYVPEWTKDGRGVLSSTYVIRFLVEVCGYSYEDALAGVIEDMRTWPCGEWPDITPEQHARKLIEDGGDIIEVLFNLKVCRLAARKPRQAAFYREVTQMLTKLEYGPLPTQTCDKSGSSTGPCIS